MSETETEATNGTSEGFKPPYGSFVTLNHLFDRMAEEGGIPARIDRSYLSNLPNSVIATTTQALKELDLTDDQLHPRPILVEIVENPDQRKSLLAGIIREKYATQLALGPRATTAQLETVFREQGGSGSTVRKAIAFFLAAARYAEVPISPYFKTPKNPNRVTGGGGRARESDLTPPPPPPPPPLVDPTSTLDPFIAGLVRTLPKPGEAFPVEKRKTWLATAENVFELIYTTGGDSTEARPFIPDGGGGE